LSASFGNSTDSPDDESESDELEVEVEVEEPDVECDDPPPDEDAAVEGELLALPEELPVGDELELALLSVRPLPADEGSFFFLGFLGGLVTTKPNRRGTLGSPFLGFRIGFARSVAAGPTSKRIKSSSPPAFNSIDSSRSKRQTR